MRTSPRSGVTSCIAVRNRVVLPEPFGPRTAIASVRAEARVHAPQHVTLPEGDVDVVELEARHGGLGDHRGRVGRVVVVGWHLGGGGVSHPRQHDVERHLHGRSGPPAPGSRATSPRYVTRPSSMASTRSGRNASASSTRCSTMTTAWPASASPRSSVSSPRRRRRIEVGERLVDDVHARPQHERAGHGQELSLASREVGRLPADEWPDPGVADHLPDPRDDLGRRHRRCSRGRTPAPTRPWRRRSAWPDPAAGCRSPGRSRAGAGRSSAVPRCARCPCSSPL